MAGFIRRFGFDPGNEVLLEIESINILDLDPPAAIAGIGTGTALLVGEFENGPFATGGNAAGQPNNQAVSEVSGPSDLIATFGGLGYDYAGVSGNNPCARARKADSAAVAEYWNGNGFVQLSGKKFRRLLIARVDTSIGTVQFQRQAFLVGGAAFTYNLEPAQILVVTDSGTDRTATFSATAATVTSGAQTFSFVGGETLVVGYDAAPNVTVTFIAGDSNQAAVISRINQAMGFTFAASVTGTTMSLTGITRGNGGQVRVVSGSAGVLTALGLTAATTAGTGNVSNIDAVTFQEVKTVVEAAMVGGLIKMSQDSSGALRLEKTYATTDDWLFVKATSTAAAGLGFSTTGNQQSNSGKAYVRSAAQTYTFTGNETLTLGNDDSANFTVAMANTDNTQALFLAKVNAAAGYTMARAISGTIVEFSSKANGGQVRIISTSGTNQANFGLTAGTTATSDPEVGGRIPAGTVVQTSDGSKKFVTMQTITVTASAIANVTASGTGPYPVKIRHATDDGTGVSTLAGTLTSLERAIDLGSFSVINLANVSSAMTEGQIDAAYSAALDQTRDTNTVSRETNIMWSARQSNTVRKLIRTNVNLASAGGCFGRMGCVRPPLGTTKATALSGSTEPGVGATRDQRIVYNFPGINTFVPAIAKRGQSGGAGFTADGNVDVGSDGFCVSVMTQLPPEENPGQLTAFTTAVNGLETSTNASGLVEDDYVAFKAKGICAPRMDDGTCIFQSGCTSVDPSVYPQLKDIARRRMADFIQDTIARRGKGYSKKLATYARRKAYASEIRIFLAGLLSKKNQNAQRIAGYTVDAKSGNDATTLGLGIYRVIVKVRTLASLDSIVLETTIGTQVEVEEQFPEAA